ncbi:hypothetical protein VNO77_28987 [Canavalia gladiata]|uniref:Uncharacterized protein n=1 Tax=Canavalia gladiata TaxID=3824 RepID=A0AAN9KXR8_CANGL
MAIRYCSTLGDLACPLCHNARAKLQSYMPVRHWSIVRLHVSGCDRASNSLTALKAWQMATTVTCKVCNTINESNLQLWSAARSVTFAFKKRWNRVKQRVKASH